MENYNCSKIFIARMAEIYISKEMVNNHVCVLDIFIDNKNKSIRVYFTDDYEKYKNKGEARMYELNIEGLIKYFDKNE